MKWYLEVLKKYAQFSGRATRTEYWMFVLCNFLIEIVYMIFGGVVFAVVGNQGGTTLVLLYIPFLLYSLALVIPSLAAAVRRLHDTGRGGAYVLVAFIPVIGPIILLVFACQESQPGTNLYGPNPHAIPGYASMGAVSQSY